MDGLESEISLSRKQAPIGHENQLSKVPQWRDINLADQSFCSTQTCTALWCSFQQIGARAMLRYAGV